MMIVLLKRLFLISQAAAFSVLAKDQSSLRKGGNLINQDKLDAVREYDAFVSRQLSMSLPMPNGICFVGNCTGSSDGPKKVCTNCCPGGFTCDTTVLGGPCKCNAQCVPKNTKCAPDFSVGIFNENCSKCCSKKFTCPSNGLGGTCTCDCLPPGASCFGPSVGPNNENCSQCCSNKFTCTPNLPGGGCTCSSF